MDVNKVHNIYFIGIGGIGMSALARYFSALGKNVAGYDKTSTDLTDLLQKEGIRISFEDDKNLIPREFVEDIENTLFVVTPAIPQSSAILNFVKENNFQIKKRAEVLGLLSQNKSTIAVAGTHGKTSVSSIITYLLTYSSDKCSAFLGGIAKNFNSNLVLTPTSKSLVVEADEYDRSFLHLFPQAAVITSIDPDHLDIYKSNDEVIRSFQAFADNINTGGVLLINKKYAHLVKNSNVKVFTYSLDDASADYYATSIQIINKKYCFNLHTPNGEYKHLVMKYPGLINVENGIAALGVLDAAGYSLSEIAMYIRDFCGIKRRFDVQIRNDDFMYIDDYAHHPREIESFLSSVKALYAGKKVTGVFQPHLYSRTRDFVSEFAKALELLDEIILLDIYPAREEPIQGVSSELIFNEIKTDKKILLTKDKLMDYIKTLHPEVIVTMGAGDIDTFVGPIKKWFEENNYVSVNK